MLKELSQVNNNVQDFSHYNALQITSFRSNIHAIGLHLLLVEDGILCSNRTVFHFIDGFCHFTRLALHELRWQWAFQRHMYTHTFHPYMDVVTHIEFMINKSTEEIHQPSPMWLNQKWNLHYRWAFETNKNTTNCQCHSFDSSTLSPVPSLLHFAPLCSTHT